MQIGLIFFGLFSAARRGGAFDGHSHLGSGP